MMPGPLPTVTVAGVFPHPEVSPALHVAALITETVSPPRLLTYRVWVLWFRAMASGARPVLIVAGVCPHPEASAALQAAALITDTVPLPPFATYTVCVAGSVITPVGLAPT